MFTERYQLGLSIKSLQRLKMMQKNPHWKVRALVNREERTN